PPVSLQSHSRPGCCSLRRSVLPYPPCVPRRERAVEGAPVRWPQDEWPPAPLYPVSPGSLPPVGTKLASPWHSRPQFAGLLSALHPSRPTGSPFECQTTG